VKENVVKEIKLRRIAADLYKTRRSLYRQPAFRGLMRDATGSVPPLTLPNVNRPPIFKYLGERMRMTAVVADPWYRCGRTVTLVDVRYRREFLAQVVTTHQTHYFKPLGPWQRGVRISFIATVAKFTSKGSDITELKLHKITSIEVVL
jgi:hypothetical protein